MASVENLAARLWPHQRDAVKVMSRYVITADRPAPRAGLVAMPTGTGKTAVMAGIIDAGRRNRNWLVLVPSRSLVRQLHRSFERGLWERLQIPRPAHFPRVAELPATSRIDELALAQAPTVYIATTQKVLAVSKELGEDGSRRAACFAGFEAILFDEGHREPSPQWSQAVRSLRLPTVLFTATPYRNDELFFETDPEFCFWYHHHQALDDGRLRTPRFATVGGKDTGEFIDEIIAFVDRHRLSRARVIIRCATVQAIVDCVRELRVRDRSVIGIQHNFARSRDRHLVDRVPDPERTDVQYWVHQYKLGEGIDDARFRVIVFHDLFENERSLVQQIGRVLRRSTSAPQKTAWVLSREKCHTADIWLRYLQFDRQNGTAIATAPRFSRCVLDVQPASAYYDRRYRSLIDLDDPELWRHLAYEPAARIYRLPVPSWPDDIDLGAAVCANYRRLDRDVSVCMAPDQQTIVVAYIAIANARVLLTGLFLSPELGFTVVRWTRERLFIYDSEGRLPDAVSALVQEPRHTLMSLMGPASRLTSVSLSNTDVGRNSIRAKTVRAAAIDAVAPDMTDYAYVCNIAEGYPRTSSLGEETYRYLGMSRARVRDGRHERIDFDGFRTWVDSVDAAIDEVDGKSAMALDRFAHALATPQDPTPMSVLLDVDWSQFAGNEGKLLSVEEYSTRVDDGKLVLRIDGSSVDACLEWDPLAERYHLYAPGLRDLGFAEANGAQRELTAAINADQLMRIVPASTDCIYIHGQFVAVPDPHTHSSGLRVLDLLTPVSALAGVDSEKGYVAANNKWANGAIFELVDGLTDPSRVDIAPMRRYFRDLETLMCTDLGTEPADFIAVQWDRIAFIHAKHGGGAIRSAKVLHEVLAQAVKNLAFLHPSNTTSPPQGMWDKPWRRTADDEPLTRLRTPEGMTGNEFWTKVRRMVTDPGTQREVWIVIGRGLSVSALRSETADSAPSAELIQIYTLLQNAWSTASQYGVQLRIFCSP